MNILYIAYSCDPYNGSEDQIGWNIPYESAKLGNKVYVITKEEQRNSIEKYCNKNNYNEINFIYVDIPSIYKKIYKGTFYSGRLKIWNHVAYKVAKEICLNNNVHIIHQITPIEFRSIGNYYKIAGVKFVVGPLGGGEYMRDSLKCYLSLKERIIEDIRFFINSLEKRRILLLKKLEKIDYVLFANEETKDFLSNKGINNVMTEIGICSSNNKKKYNHKDKIIFLISGRLIPRKGHFLLLDVLKKIPNDYDYEIRIVGGGYLYSKIKEVIDSDTSLKNKVALVGQVDYLKMSEEYSNADVLIMPSLRETTGTVILEALSNGLPVISYNGYGAKIILNNNIAYLYEGITRKEIISSFLNQIIECLSDRKKLNQKQKKALEESEKYYYSSKVKIYNNIYNELINNK